MPWLFNMSTYFAIYLHILCQVSPLAHEGHKNISSVDALWALIQGQAQSVKDALYRRMEEANLQRKTLQQQQYVDKSLKRAFAELEEARTTNMELPDASDLFKLMDKQ